MAAEICLLLMQSLTEGCDAHFPQADAPIPQQLEESEAIAAAPTAIPVAAIAPAATTAAPQFGQFCEETNAHTLAVCSLPSKAAENRTMSLSTNSSERAVAAVSEPSVTAPVAVTIPRSPYPVPSPPAPFPQFSAPGGDVAPPSVPTRPLTVRRPTSGPQLYSQRRLALSEGRSYTRLSPDAYINQWSQVTQQPTYEDWKTLLAQEARAIAGGQGQNRLEVVVGDSFGLWLPPELLPRDRLWLNQSISGDTTAGILQRVGAFAHTRPTTIHLMAGTNDLKNGVPEVQIIRNLQQTVRALKQQHPQAQIVVYSVLPTRRADIANERVRSLNTRIAALTQFNGVEYRNIHQWFQDEVGYLRQDLTTDGLHLNPQGYVLWQRAILARVG